MRLYFTIICSFILVSLLGCGTTKIYVSDSDAYIYQNNLEIGKGSAQIKKIGPPENSYFEAKKDGILIGDITVKREFTFATIIIGLYSYGLGLYYGWYYPDVIMIPIKEEKHNTGTNSIWMLELPTMGSPQNKKER